MSIKRPISISSLRNGAIVYVSSGDEEIYCIILKGYDNEYNYLSYREKVKCTNKNPCVGYYNDYANKIMFVTLDTFIKRCIGATQLKVITLENSYRGIDKDISYRATCNRFIPIKKNNNIRFINWCHTEKKGSKLYITKERNVSYKSGNTCYCNVM